MCHIKSLYEIVYDTRLRNTLSISEEQVGFLKGKGSSDAIVVLR